MVGRIKRVRRTVQQKQGATKEEVRLMQRKLQLISESQEEIARLQGLVNSYSDELLADMTAAGLDNLVCPVATATITRSAGKAQNIIDPKGLRGKLKSDKEFYACLSVSVTKAKEFLSAKELDSITTKIPGKEGERKLKVTAAGK